MWKCNECGGQVKYPADSLCSVFEPDQAAWWRAILSGGKTAVVCPLCGSSDIVELEPCPTCDGGWKTHDEQVCQKCHLRNVNDIRLFVRQYRAETLDDMDKIIEGESLRNFQ